MTGAIVITWGSPVRGREAKSLEVFGEALAFFEGLAKQGRIHGHREYLSITGDVSKWGGMEIVEGDLEDLLRLQTEDGYRRLMEKAAAIVDCFTTQITVGGSDRAVQEQITRYMETLQGLGYL